MKCPDTPQQEWDGTYDYVPAGGLPHMGERSREQQTSDEENKKDEASADFEDTDPLTCRVCARY